LKTLLHTWLLQFNLPETTINFVTVFLICSAIFLFAIIVTIIFKRILLPLVLNWVQSNNYTWDDPLYKNRFFQRASWFIPVMIISLSIDTLIDNNSSTYILIKRMASSAYVVVTILTVTALLGTINDIHKLVRKSKGQHLQAYIDAAKIVVYILGAIFITSIFTGKSPWGILSVLGGLTAVTMLVFKDSILGFVASIQLTSTDMVRVGDWVEMEQYGADGDVIAMSIHTIRVQNWDKTITTIPTYALVASSFKNWRGMAESGGRRIKRALYLDIHSISFLDDETLARFAKITLLKEYLGQKSLEIEEYNSTHLHDDSFCVNGRRQTNVGVFRAYIIAYLKNHKKIHQNMTFLVRQLPPREYGLPLEIYVFSKDQAWARYEEIQADIFDHLLAAAPEFGLRIFQNPTGYDFRNLKE
jgi:miniconductance mechanosensitive channel